MRIPGSARLGWALRRLPRANVRLESCAEFVSVGVFLGKNACRAVHLKLPNCTFAPVEFEDMHLRRRAGFGLRGVFHFGEE
jgi:hypothetical protein